MPRTRKAPYTGRLVSVEPWEQDLRLERDDVAVRRYLQQVRDLVNDNATAWPVTGVVAGTEVPVNALVQYAACPGWLYVIRVDPVGFKMYRQFWGHTVLEPGVRTCYQMRPVNWEPSFGDKESAVRPLYMLDHQRMSYVMQSAQWRVDRYRNRNPAAAHVWEVVAKRFRRLLGSSVLDLCADV